MSAMTRFLIVSYPALGHVNPTLAIARELVAAGEEVTVVTSASFARRFRAAGALVLTPRVAPDVYVAETLTPRSAGRMITGLARRMIVEIVSTLLVARLRADLVLVDAMWEWPARVAGWCGARVALLSTTYAVTEGMPWRWTRHGRAFSGPLTRLHRHRPQVRRINHAGLVLVNSLPELQPAVDTLPARLALVGPLLGDQDGEDDDQLGRWLDSRRGRVLFVSAGTVFARGAAFFRRVIAAFAEADGDWSVVIATGHLDPREVGEPPANVVVRRRVPQIAVLARADVFLTHAGANSVHEAVRAGVPMIVAPRARDQWFIARRLIELRVALALPPVATGPEGLRSVVEYVAADRAMRDRMRSWSSTVAAMTPATSAADRLRMYARG